MQKDEIMLQKRLEELSETAFQRGIVIFSDFLNLNELNILHTTPRAALHSQYSTFGGYVLSERQMVAFLPDALYYDYNYPITILKIEPLQKKFSEQLTHRDYLGAILNLGIERSKIGDILVEDSCAYIFIQDMLASFVIEQLTRIRHTAIMVTETDDTDVHCEPKFEEITGSVPSTRLDCLLALVYNSSRSKLVALIEGGKVFVNGKLITSNGYQVKENDIISVRGIGRFSFKGILSQTKKGRYYVSVQKFI